MNNANGATTNGDETGSHPQWLVQEKTQGGSMDPPPSFGVNQTAIQNGTEKHLPVISLHYLRFEELFEASTCTTISSAVTC